MRAAFLVASFLLACQPEATPQPDPCPNCNPAKCPDPIDVVPDASCNVVPLVCPMSCGLKCQCWNDAWTCIVGSSCDAGEDADGGEAGDAGEASDAADAD